MPLPPRPPENDLKAQIDQMIDREVLGRRGRPAEPLVDGLDALKRMCELIQSQARPRAIIHAHFEVDTYKRQWMTDGSVIHWTPLSWLSAVEWRKYGEETPPHGLAHQLNAAAYTGFPLTITDPYSTINQRRD